MKFKLILPSLLFYFISFSAFSQGCLIANYDQFDKVFNRPTSSGATTFTPGNGYNFVN
ncbi:MAG: hypothetical protein ABWZ79_00295 [Pedobacter agri]|uniref:hypothetical protein n=1 Tax=Pedobacter agri TaxID=454586 RepID=UPI002780DE80|nr:hypothetical protein [Pedobacter agri]MDQ1142855.1 hypothetical protein [Pedobacter agri]